MFQRSANVNCPQKFVLPGVLRSTTNTAGTFKSILTGLLLCCVLVDPVIVTFTWLHCQKTVIKKEVERQIIAGMDKDELVLLIFSKEEAQTRLRWEHSREFEYNDKMYDIVKTKTVGETVYYWCWYDHKETMLNRQLEKLSDRTLRKNPKIRSEIGLLASYLRTLYCIFSFNGDLTTPEFSNKHVILFYRLCSQFLIQPPTPPPQLS